MNNFILSAVAAGALALGGAASAQDLGSILGNIFGYYGNQSTPAVVAGTVPHGSQVYVDPSGRQVHVDQYGRHVYVQPNTSNYGIVGYDAWGRPVYGTTHVYNQPNVYGDAAYPGYAASPSWDRDGDGIANSRDRWPDDRRYW